MKTNPHCLRKLVISAVLLPLAILAQSGPPPLPPADYDTMLNTWPLNNGPTWQSWFGDPPRSATNLAIVPGWLGTALNIDTNAAWLNYDVFNADGSTNVAFTDGTIMEWYSPDFSSVTQGGTGPGEWASLLTIGRFDVGAAYGCWSIAIDPNGTNLVFVAQTNGASQSVFSIPIDWNAGDWHFLAMTYTETNCAVFLDGAWVTNAAPILYWPGAAECVSDGMWLGSAPGGDNQGRGTFQFLRTYNYAVDSNDIADAYNVQSSEILNWGGSLPLSGGFGPMIDPPSLPGGGGGGGGTPLGDGYVDTNSYYSTNFYLEMLPYTGSNSVNLVLFSTTNLYGYEILSSTNLTDWQVETQFMGAPGTNATAFTVPMNGRPALFFQAMNYTMDSQGTGIPDWWWLKNFGAIGDPYADPDDDGWNNLQEYLNGTNPNVANTPPPPIILSAVPDSTAAHVTLTWQSGGGVVSNYGIEVFSSEVTTVGSNTFQATVATDFDDSDESLFFGDGPDLTVRAYFPGGAHADSAPAVVGNLAYCPNAVIVRGSNALPYLVAQSPPPDLSFFRLVWSYLDGFGDPVYAHFDLPASNLVNGVMAVPTNAWMPLTNSANYSLAAFSTNGSFGLVSASIGTAGLTAPEEEDAYVTWGFADSRHHLKENLKFLLRAATASDTFNYDAESGGNDPNFAEEQSPYFYSARPAATNGYECSGFRQFDNTLGFSFLDEHRPLEDNFLWRNFAFSNADLTSGVFNTGQGYDSTDGDAYRTLTNPKYYATSADLEPSPLPVALSSTNSPWLYFNDTIASYPPYMPDLGFFTNSDGTLSLASGSVNCYGLPLNSAHFLSGGSYVTLNAGSGRAAYSGSLFVEAAQPTLTNLGYYFASQTPYLGNPPFGGFLDYAGAPSPLPGSPAFFNTNTAPLLIASVGQLYSVSAWAKLGLANGYSDRYGYLEQYFSGAYTMDASGHATTTNAGLISPYGEFYPTQPGPAAVVTLPDIDTGQTATNTVNVIKLQLDVNHDGVMDLSWNGPDNTSPQNPFVFWVNSDHDWSFSTSDPGQDIESVPKYADYTFQNIPSQRDLEDWARMWVCGMPALPMDEGYQVMLTWNVSSGNPAINLVNSIEIIGGTGYLTDTNIAASQASGSTSSSASYKFARITPGQSYTFPDGYFTNAGNKYFLFEGAGIGAGQLMLTVSKGSNLIAQTSAWLDLHDIKDLYEAAVITNNMTGAKSNWTSSVETVMGTQSQKTNETRDIIALVHGINVPYWNWINSSETVFKRLYWSRYDGKFVTIDWPCNLLTPIPSPLTPAVFNLSELQAYKASTALTNYLAGLRARFPGYRLHLLAHSQGNAVASEAIKNGAFFDTYILTQGALPASAYDFNAPTNSTMLSYDIGSNITPDQQPKGYHGIYTNFTGRIINFFNSEDGVLNYWVTDQEIEKPTVFADSSLYYYDGTNSYYVPFFGTPYLVVDLEESRAMVARSRTLPIGQSGPTTGHGVIQSGIDLNAQYGFGSAISEHSAQWTRPIQTSAGYYLQVFDSIGP